MTLPNNFHFTQSSLQDYLECQRRFELRYLLRVKWPARVVDDPQEYRVWMELGSRFHALLHRYFLGISPGLLEKSIEDGTLRLWWQQFIDWWESEGYTGKTYPEYTLYSTLNGYKLAAKYDLLLCQEDGRILIFDWKTSQKRTPRSHLDGRIQTRLYPLVAAQAGAELNHGNAVHPEDLEMLYWFANHPQDGVLFPYSAARMQQDLAHIEKTVAEIQAKRPGEFALTADHKRCTFCPYRTLCDRDEQPGDWMEMQDSQGEDYTALLNDFENELDQIGEAWL